MNRVKEIITIALALAVGVAASPADQPITGQRRAREDHRGIRAALKEDPELLNQANTARYAPPPNLPSQM